MTPPEEDMPLGPSTQWLEVTDSELRELAEDIVKYCPSLTHLLLALGSKNSANPIAGLN